MQETIRLSCRCGQTRLVVERKPIASVECCCTSCRTAGHKLETLPGAPTIVEANGATHLVVYRKDRVQLESGGEYLGEHRLSPVSATRRVMATCCNTLIFTEFTKGHWLSMHARLWPAEIRPPVQMRAMTSDALADAHLSGDVPNAKKYPFKFFLKLMRAWAAMGFKVPKIAFVQRTIDV